jgi:hypothetical protein
MVSLTLAVPDDLKKEMDRYPELNWSAVARKAIEEKVALLKRLNELTANSKLTEKDALELGDMVNRKVAERYRKMFGKKR